MSLKSIFEYDDDRIQMSKAREGVIHNLTYDQVGFLRLVADGAGNVIKKIEYDAFGNFALDFNPGPLIPFGFGRGLRGRSS